MADSMCRKYFDNPNLRDAGALKLLDTKLEGGMTAVNSKIDTGLEDLHSKITTGLGVLNSKIDTGLGDIDSKVDIGFASIMSILTAVSDLSFLRYVYLNLNVFVPFF
jgi:hypothetical protein